MRIVLAFQAFFAILFTGKAPLKALPPPPEPKPDEELAKRQAVQKELDEVRKELKELKASEKALRGEHEALTVQHKAASEELAALKADSSGHAAEVESAKELAAKEAAAAQEALKKERDEARAALEAAQAEVGEKTKRLEELKASAEAAGGKLKQARDDGALALLGWLQREGRLIDFLRESIDDYEDDQVGAAVRAIHSGCRKVLDEALALQPILEGDENEPVTVPSGFDPVAISLSGNVKGDPPFKGTLMHHGWRTETVSVPVPETVDPRVLAPAEVEL